ncbi:MAG: serine protease, partial [Deltaproteobacteria bacterium]|nr:serine protease [Deltaproteobacteria bacterium]
MVNLTNTGGPIVNLAGELVGIASAKLTEKRGMRGLGYGIPAHAAQPLLAGATAGDVMLRRSPPLDRNPLRGLDAANLDESVRHRFAISDDIEHGAVITTVTADSPAARVGVEAGDVILEVDFEPILSTSGFERAVGEGAGPILVLVVRGNAATYVLLHPRARAPPDASCGLRPPGSGDREQEVRLAERTIGCLPASPVGATLPACAADADLAAVVLEDDVRLGVRDARARAAAAATTRTAVTARGAGTAVPTRAAVIGVAAALAADAAKL